MRIHSTTKYLSLKFLFLSTTILLYFSILAISAQVDCTGCTPAFNTIEDTVSLSCEITYSPAFPSYTNDCTGLDVSEATFVATLGQSTSCEGNVALAIGAGQDLCLTLSGFQNAGLAPSDRFFVGSESLSWTHYANGSATLTGVVYNEADVADAYAMEVYMEGGYNWTEWNAMGNLVLDALEQGTEQDWIYFILINNMSKLTGVGVNAGKTIRLTHSPLSEDLGFQLGSMGANNINLNHGLGGWVNWEVLEAGNTLGGVGNITIDLTNCVNSEYTCADDNDILYRFYAGNICGYDQVDILIDHTDNTPPSWTYVPGDLTQECSDTPILEDATATDLCSELSISIVSDTLFGSAEGNYIVTRTFTAEDACGNATSATQTITTIDTTSPALTIPADYTAECSDAHPMDDASATDNCGVVTIDLVETTINGACAGEFSITRAFTATDDAGNSTSETQTITIVDTTSPILTIPADYTAECSDAHPMDDASATDNCGEVTIEVVETTIAGVCAGDYSITRAFTATDDCGNVASATQTITSVDTTAPSLIVPGNLSLSCLDSNDIGTPTSSDFCSDVLLTIVSDTTLGACPAQYMITRTFVASDNCGNSATASQTIEYSDITPPSFGSTASYLEFACSEEAVFDAEAFDSCSDVSELTYIDNFGSGGCASPTSNIVRVLTAVDACGNVASMEQTIQFIDTVAPIFTYIPSDIAIDCSTDYPFDFPVITDGCSDVNLDYTLDTISMSASHDYTVSVLWTATDACGNEKTVSQFISVSDTESPIFTQAPNLPAFLEVGTPLPSCNTLEWTASDNCYASNTLVFDCSLDTIFTDNGPCVGPYEIHYAYSLSDPSGNTSAFSHVIMMTDLAPPVWISIPENATADCDEEIIWEEPVANGLNDILWEITIDTVPGLCQNAYELVRTMTPMDGCGITGDTHTNSIFVSDGVSPEFIGVPTDLSISCEDEIPLMDISAIDNCTADVLVSDSTFISPGTCEGNYVILHELIAEDLCGNTTMASYTISIADTLAPVFINSPEDLVLELGDEVLACDEAEIQIEDNCSSVEWTCEEMIEPGSCLGATTHLRTYTASDACGNQSVATQVVLILDTTAPEFTFFPPNLTLPCDGDTLPLATNILSGYDLGSPDSLTYTFEGLTTGGDDCNIENMRVYRVSDDCGNYVDSTHVTLLIDTVAPTLNTPLEDLSFTCLYDMSPCDVDQLDISDNCNTTTSSCTDLNLEGDCDNEPCTIERIYTIADLCGNSLDISQIISITASPTDSLCDPSIAIEEPSMFTSNQPSCIPYPNPIRAFSQGGSINLLNCPDMTEWVLLNSLGKVVAHGQSSTIQVNNLTQGLYFLRANGYGTQRIVVLK